MRFLLRRYSLPIGLLAVMAAWYQGTDSMSSDLLPDTKTIREVQSSLVTIIALPREAGQANERSFGGLIIAADGTVLTSRRLIGEAANFEVTMADGQKYASKSIAFDSETDIAIIRLEIKDKVSFVGWSDKCRTAIGSRVLCVALSPLIHQSMTRGLISSETTTELPGEPFLFVDTSIGVGVSCSVVIDEKGKVVGFIGSRPTDSKRGRTAAIHYERLAQIIRELLTKGKVEREKN